MDRYECFFNVDYENFAWQYVNSGAFIMSDGKVYKYRFTERSDNNRDLEYKFKNSRYVKTVSTQKLQELCQKLHQVSHLDYKTKHTAHDAGSTVFNGYMDGQEIKLGQSGDSTGVNEETRPLVEELARITGFEFYIIPPHFYKR